MKMQKTKLAAACILAIGLAACSSDDDDDNPIANDDPVIQDPADPADPAGGDQVSAAMTEATALMDGLAAIGGTPFDADTAIDFPDAYNVFIPSVTGFDLTLISDENPSGPTARLPMFQGLGPNGEPVDYIITEASDQEVAEFMGVIWSPRMLAGANSAGAQLVTLNNDGLMEFVGAVDFSPTRSVTPGDPNATEGPNSITRSEFPPATIQPGAIADAEWSSLVVLPSGQVLNAQLVANATGLHDRIPDSTQDDQNNPNLDRVNRFVVMQLLDGWQGDERFYYHFVTDASVPDAASIELGVFAPRLGELPTAGIFPEGARLGFSPNVNGIFSGPDGSQGLNVTTTDQSIDPVNVFPFDPTDPDYSPMWDIHLSMWTSEAIDTNQRRVITSTEDLQSLINQGLVENFFGNAGPSNPLIAGLSPTGAIINCPVVLQPDESVAGTSLGVFEN